MTTSHKPYKTLLEDYIHNRSGTGLKVLNADGDNPVIRIYDVIGWPWVTADDVASQLDQITASEIEVQIASPGGSVYEGMAIYNALRTHKAKITTRVDSMAASIASVIAQAGDHRIMLTGSQMMIHDPWTITWGSAAEIRKTAEVLDKQSSIIAGAYAERADKDPDHFAALMEEETWFTATETVEAGLADEVVKPARADDDPEDRARNSTRFVEQTESVLTEYEQLVARAEEVIAFRTDQGKAPLSEDSVELFEKLDEAHNRLTAALASESTQPANALDVEAEYLKFVEITQGV